MKSAYSGRVHETHWGAESMPALPDVPLKVGGGGIVRVTAF